MLRAGVAAARMVRPMAPSLGCCRPYTSLCKAPVRPLVGVRGVWAPLRTPHGQTHGPHYFVGACRGVVDLREDTVEEPTEVQRSNTLMPLEEYFAVRSRVNNQGLVAGSLFAVATFFGSSQFTAIYFQDVIGNPYADPPIPPEMIWGMDPMIVLSMGVMTSTAVGFGFSRVLYRKLWEWKNSDLAAKIEERKSDIFHRVEKHRATGEEQNDDYYGESIKSASTYLVWLRKQKARRAEIASYEQETS
eukprot:m.174070 g.174070  ORF g.174070 m.174070 type:complete len:246 (-) comp13782_c0_seq1:58-795(-)